MEEQLEIYRSRVGLITERRNLAFLDGRAVILTEMTIFMTMLGFSLGTKMLLKK